jgi:type II secretory pathway component GspD/PulD (secretin)
MRNVAIGGGAINLIVQLPTIEFRSVRTTVTLPDGGTILMSGLMLDNKFDAHDGVPFLSDLPIIGRLFGYDLKQRFKRNLLIVVSAQLILFDEEEAKL